VIAISLGARIIEKHITLNKNATGPDHLASMEIDEFTRFIDTIRKTEHALGQEIKVPSPSELENRKLVRKSIYTSKLIQKGEIFDETNLTTKRPADGLSPTFWDDLIGKPSKRSYLIDERVDEHEL
jgi:N,N'-diacetyllegionaminate synthase